jgi:hypothetical protein
MLLKEYVGKTIKNVSVVVYGFRTNIVINVFASKLHSFEQLLSRVYIEINPKRYL